MSIQERIRAIEEEMARTQINKATNRHLGVLKARIARLKEQEREKIEKSRGKKEEGYTIRKDGDATVVKDQLSGATIALPAISVTSTIVAV